MEYNVYYHSFNGDEIKTLNVLREDSYIMSRIKEYRKEDMSKEEFVEELRLDCFRMYCSRSEYEVVISAWVGKAKEKIDVYGQLRINWNVFSDICWKLYMGE